MDAFGVNRVQRQVAQLSALAVDAQVLDPSTLLDVINIKMRGLSRRRP